MIHMDEETYEFQWFRTKEAIADLSLREIIQQQLYAQMLGWA